MKCPISCKNVALPDKCEKHRKLNEWTSIYEEFINRANDLIENVKNDNLVHYIGIKFTIDNEDKLVIYLVQEYVNGTSIYTLCKNGGNVPNVTSVTKAILNGISHLHDFTPEVTHGYLNNKSIFLDETHTCRIADYDLIPYLMYLKGTNNHLHKVCDLVALASVVNGLYDLYFKSKDDFIEQCHSGKVLSYRKLLSHPFVSNKWFPNTKPISDDYNLSEDFKIEKKLGSGSFGIVLQAKKHRDEKPYAIKLIRIPTQSKKELEQIEREAEIISGLSHANVVKYITNWKQEINLEEIEEYIEDEECMELSQSAHTSDSDDRYTADVMIIQMELCCDNLK